VPDGKSTITARSRSIVSARDTACARAVVTSSAGGSSTQITPAVRWSAPTARPSMSRTNRRAQPDASPVSRSMIRDPSGVSARLVAEAIPGIASRRSVSRRSRAIPSGVNSCGSSYAASTTSLEPKARAIRR
jgi:hypothetical protein